MKMKATIMGCGSSPGVPMAGNFWGTCDPNEPRNRRTRSSMIVESQNSRLLVDAGHDLRLHLNQYNIQNLDGVLITHAHSDHVNGLDDLRGIQYKSGNLIDTYTDLETFAEVERMWPHLFRGSADGTYHATLGKKVVEPYNKFKVGDIEVEAIEQDHKTCNSLGFRFGKFAYSVDFMGLNDRALEGLQGIDTWFVGCAGYQRETPLNHATLKQVMEWVAIIQPKMTYLGVMTIFMDYKTMCDELPPHIRPAYDGLEINF